MKDVKERLRRKAKKILAPRIHCRPGTMCLWCGRFIEVKRNGNMKTHKAAGGVKCAGSDKPDEFATRTREESSR